MYLIKRDIWYFPYCLLCGTYDVCFLFLFIDVYDPHCQIYGNYKYCIVKKNQNVIFFLLGSKDITAIHCVLLVHSVRNQRLEIFQNNEGGCWSVIDGYNIWLLKSLFLAFSQKRHFIKTSVKFFVWLDTGIATNGRDYRYSDHLC